MNRMVVFVLVALQIGVFSQNIEFDVGANYPFEITVSGTDPNLAAEDYYGILGGEGKWLWEINTYNLYVEGLQITSDERAKENITDLPSVVQKLKAVKTVKYDYKAKNISKIKNSQKRKKIEKRRKNHVGFLTQNLMKEFPELVEYNEKRDVYSVNYNGMIPILLKAIKEQQVRIEQLESKVAKGLK